MIVIFCEVATISLRDLQQAKARLHRLPSPYHRKTASLAPVSCMCRLSKKRFNSLIQVPSIWQVRSSDTFCCGFAQSTSTCTTIDAVLGTTEKYILLLKLCT